MSLRFKAGDLAVYAVPRSCAGLEYVGQVVEVVAVGPWNAGEVFDGQPFKRASDYVVEAEDGCLGETADWQLRSLDPPLEPLSLTLKCDAEFNYEVPA